MARPLREVFLDEGREVHPPADAIHPGRWIAGFTMQLVHWRSPLLGHCIACGSTATHCRYWYAGWITMRESLADPSVMPLEPP